MDENLKLYVWDGALKDWTGGIIFALAPDVETARKLVEQRFIRESGKWAKRDWPYKHMMKDIQAKPQVFTRPMAKLVSGGG